jgi:hypothetical protein
MVQWSIALYTNLFLLSKTSLSELEQKTQNSKHSSHLPCESISIQFTIHLLSFDLNQKESIGNNFHVYYCKNRIVSLCFCM